MSGRVSALGEAAGTCDGRYTSRGDARRVVTSPAPPGGSAIRSDPSRDETSAGDSGKGMMQCAPPRTTPPCGRPRRPREAIAGGAPTWCPSSLADARFGDAPSARAPMTRARVAGSYPKGGDLSEPPDEVVPKWDRSSDVPSRRPVARARRLSLRDSSARRAFPTGQRRFARTMDATQTMSETARSSFLGDTMPHILAVRAFPPWRASLPAPTAHFWHSRAGDWDALAITSDSAHLPRTFPTHPYPPPIPTTAGRRVVHARRRGRQGVHPTRVRRRDPAPHHPPRDPKVRSPSPPIDE